MSVNSVAVEGAGAAPGGAGSFSRMLEDALSAEALVKLVLGKYRGTDAGLVNLYVRPVRLKAGDSLVFVYRYRTRDVTKQVPVPEGVARIMTLVGTEFRSAHLFSKTQTVQLEFNKKGVGRLSVGPVTPTATSGLDHDHLKARVIDPARPFLRELGVTGPTGQVFPSMSRKWKQINVFLGLFQRALADSGLGGDTPLRVVDFGSGKGYLTFAVHDFLSALRPGKGRVTGIERRADLAGFCQGVAKRLGLEGLSFEQGDVESCPPGPMDVMIALHACDTATDLAIHAGISGGAGVIMCAPCCHKEIRPQMVNPAVLEPLLRIGIHQGQEAEMVTDTLRALWLDASGYETQVFEFVSLEHTSKNKMILAVKRAQPALPGPVLEQIKALKAFYGIQHHKLEMLLNPG